jgi:hypothetical protein
LDRILPPVNGKFELLGEFTGSFVTGANRQIDISSDSGAFSGNGGFNSNKGFSSNRGFSSNDKYSLLANFGSSI